MSDKIVVYKCKGCGVNKYPEGFAGCMEKDIAYQDWECEKCGNPKTAGQAAAIQHEQREFFHTVGIFSDENKKLVLDAMPKHLTCPVKAWRDCSAGWANTLETRALTEWRGFVHGVSVMESIQRTRGEGAFKHE